ncbi:MAG: hypothetical protein NC254_12780 [bacterium]|nr:hypothetical protein [bacterium]
MPAAGDDEYYLHHDFYEEDSKYGCLYVRERADVDAGIKFVIYGHNMRDGAMFRSQVYNSEDESGRFPSMIPVWKRRLAIRF